MHSFECASQEEKKKKKQANTIIFTAQLYRVLPWTHGWLSSVLEMFSQFFLRLPQEGTVRYVECN